MEANNWRQVDASDSHVKELSQLLQSLAIHQVPRNPDFRNPATAAMKTYNIASAHPDYQDHEATATG